MNRIYDLGENLRQGMNMASSKASNCREESTSAACSEPKKSEVERIIASENGCGFAGGVSAGLGEASSDLRLWSGLRSWGRCYCVCC